MSNSMKVDILKYYKFDIFLLSYKNWFVSKIESFIVDFNDMFAFAKYWMNSSTESSRINWHMYWSFSPILRFFSKVSGSSFDFNSWVKYARYLSLYFGLIKQSMIDLLICSGEIFVDHLYETYRNKDFLYDVLLKCICSSDLLKENTEEKEKNPNLKDISKDFYEGFGNDLINRDSKS